MGECNNNNNRNERKRVRDLETDSPESKIIRVDPASSVDANSSESQLTRVNSAESCVDSHEFCELGRVDSDDSVINEIHDEFLNMLDEMDNVTERDPTMQGMDSGIIFTPVPGSVDPDLVPQSAEFNPSLGYLLEASDDELGLPPTVTPNSEEAKVETQESGRVGPEGVDLTGFLGFEFEDDIRMYESFGLGNGVVYDGYIGENGGSYVTIDALFDYAVTEDILWRSESLQAML